MDVYSACLCHVHLSVHHNKHDKNMCLYVGNKFAKKRKTKKRTIYLMNCLVRSCMGLNKKHLHQTRELAPLAGRQGHYNFGMLNYRNYRKIITIINKYKTFSERFFSTLFSVCDYN